VKCSIVARARGDVQTMVICLGLSIAKALKGKAKMPDFWLVEVKWLVAVSATLPFLLILVPIIHH
jgi:hypothetical protein